MIQLAAGVLRRVWRDILNDNVGFLAGAVAFNILLAGVPFLLLMAAALGYLLGESPDRASQILQSVLERVLPSQLGVGGAMLNPVVEDVQRTRAVFGIGGALGYLWFSVRLFGSLRSVMKTVFSHARDRTVIVGIVWDLTLSVLTVLLLSAWVVLTSFIALSSGRVGAALTELGVRQEVLGGATLLLGRALAFVVVAAIFGSLYRWLPKQRTDWVPTAAGAITAAICFDLARWIFGRTMAAFPPESVYSGTIGALLVLVFWTYYAALIFVIGAEVASATREELQEIEASTAK